MLFVLNFEEEKNNLLSVSRLGLGADNEHDARLMTQLAVGVDVGGTFTDVVCSDGSQSWTAKAYTDPGNFGAGVLAGLELLATQMNSSVPDLLASVARLGLGTTAVTNVLATRSGRKVGLITTKGFEGHLRAARGRRVTVDGWLNIPWAPVKEQCVRGINERVDRSGEIITPMNATDLEAAASDLVCNENIEAFAVSFVWSCRNAHHEQQAIKKLNELYPNIPAFSGVALLPILREYERTSAAALNAFCANALDGVNELESKLTALGLKVPMLLMHTTGGAITVPSAQDNPVGLASSGPAAGAAAAGELCRILDIPQAVCADMGGTSIDVAVVENGKPKTRQRGEINGIFTAQPSIDIESVGAGGGSIAWVDRRNLLRVGPQSARANPGPVCYGRGGTEPTITDAMVLLGYIDPTNFLKGAVELDREAAHAECARLGQKIGLEAMDVAHGIREIAIAEMSKVLRAKLAQQGMSLNATALIAFGGSGALFAPAVAANIGMSRVVSPSMASVFSSFGAAMADLRRERVAPIDTILPCDEETLLTINDAIDQLCNQVSSDLASDGVTEDSQEVSIFGDFRFYRQRSELTLSLGSKSEFSESFDVESAIASFKEAYVKRYSDAALAMGAPVELVCLRAVGTGRMVKATISQNRPQSKNNCQPSGARSVYLGGGKSESVKTYTHEQLEPGNWLTGPALIDASDTTIWVPERAIAEVDTYGALHIKLNEARGHSG